MRSILPKDLQRKTAKELLAAQNAQSDTSAIQDTQNAGVSDPNVSGANGVTADPNASGTVGTTGNATDLNASGANGAATDPNANGTLGAAGNAADSNTTGASGSTTNPDTTGAASNANSSGTVGTTGSAGSTNPAGSTDTQSTEEAAIQDYVQTYTSMRPRNAAQVFDSMLPDQLQLVVKILKNMKPAQRSAILAQMNVQNASDVTVEMNKELP